MEKDILKLHKTGLSNRQIAKSLGYSHHLKVGEIIKKNNLKPNGSSRGSLKIKNDKGLCTKCGKWKDLGAFKVNRRNKSDEYRLTYCNPCGWSARNNYLNTNIDAYLNDRYNTLKQHSIRRSKEFNLEKKDILFMYKKQKGLCAYTGIPLKAKKGSGMMDDTLSFDRWDNSKGYVRGNVLLCSKKVNMSKCNLTLDEFRVWMPDLYSRGSVMIRMWKKEGIQVVDVGNGVEF